MKHRVAVKDPGPRAAISAQPDWVLFAMGHGPRRMKSTLHLYVGPLGGRMRDDPEARAGQQQPKAEFHLSAGSMGGNSNIADQIHLRKSNGCTKFVDHHAGPASPETDGMRGR